MSNHWIDPNSCPTLIVLVDAVAGPLLMQHKAPIVLETDIDGDLPVPADAVGTAELLRTLVDQAIEEMPDGGELTVTACETARGIELEIADTGEDADQRIQRLPMTAAAIGAELAWQNCPQGGVAVTVVFPPPQQQRERRAA